jgi:thymidylate kinase
MMISIVGADGAGKTTQIEKLVPWLCDTHRRAVRVVTKESALDLKEHPEARMFALDYSNLSGDILVEMQGVSRALFLFYLSAAALPRRIAEGEILLLDGYWIKDFATEAALGLQPEWLLSVGRLFPRPTITILLDVAPEIAAKRRCA